MPSGAFKSFQVQLVATAEGGNTYTSTVKTIKVGHCDANSSIVMAYSAGVIFADINFTYDILDVDASVPRFSLPTFNNTQPLCPITYSLEAPADPRLDPTVEEVDGLVIVKVKAAYRYNTGVYNLTVRGTADGGAYASRRANFEVRCSESSISISQSRQILAAQFTLPGLRLPQTQNPDQAFIWYPYVTTHPDCPITRYTFLD